ncbi:MAG: hypothetical protein GF418_04580 [Chitinivibrionales bacterium]|nr:hypothetical protein [Chitinivibrionales bacterium]MBD3394884.1 hypothetical protein [Chitinivibrionales bacterium]
MTVQRALLSVSDKTGIVELGRTLAGMNVDIISTGGTAKLLLHEGLTVRPIESYTGFPEIMDGRVKTLHPRVHGGLLAVRDNPGHLQQMTANNILPIDLVVVNLYPFKQTVAKPGVSEEDAIENIDIGGPTMIRSSAKNHRYVTIVVDPADYEQVTSELKKNGEIPLDMRKRFAVKAFEHTADYDTAISAYLAKAFGK